MSSSAHRTTRMRARGKSKNKINAAKLLSSILREYTIMNWKRIETETEINKVVHEYVKPWAWAYIHQQWIPFIPFTQQWQISETPFCWIPGFQVCLWIYLFFFFYSRFYIKWLLSTKWHYIIYVHRQTYIHPPCVVYTRIF